MEKKRYLSITLAMCLVFSILSGCGGQAAQSPQTQAAGGKPAGRDRGGIPGGYGKPGFRGYNPDWGIRVHHRSSAHQWPEDQARGTDGGR